MNRGLTFFINERLFKTCNPKLHCGWEYQLLLSKMKSKNKVSKAFTTINIDLL